MKRFFLFLIFALVLLSNSQPAHAIKAGELPDGSPVLATDIFVVSKDGVGSKRVTAANVKSYVFLSTSNLMPVSGLAFTATDRLACRDTASAGAGEECTVGGGLEFTGSTGLQRSALTGDVTATAGSNTTAIASGVIVNADVNASAAIDASKIADGSVSSAEFQYINSLSSNAQTQISAKQAGDTTLTALAAYNTNGLIAQTAADTFAGRTVTGTTDKITVTNGDGVSGNPTLTIAATYAGQNTITTLGTVSTAVYQATPIGIAYGGLGAAYTDPNADRILFWDDSAGAFGNLTVSTGLDLTGTTLTSTITQYTDEAAQDATGAMVDSSLTYVDATPLLQRAALTGDVTASAGSNTTAIASGVIVNADVNASAAIALSKLATDPLARANHTGTQAPATVTFAATDRLLCRDTASGGTGEECTVGGGVEFTGTTGIQRSALTGDVTATAGSNTTAIASGVIVNADVNASAAIALSKLATDPLARANHTGTQAPATVTFAATDRLLCRDTASGGTGEECTVGGGVEFTGSTGVQRSALTGDVTASAGSNTTAIASGVIVDADVNASAALTATKIADGSVTSAEFQYINTLSSNAQTQIDAKAAKTQTFQLTGFIETAANKTYRLVQKSAYAMTIVNTTTKSVSGTCTATFKIDGVNLGGTANSVTSSEQTQAQASANAVSVGNDLDLTISSNSTCLDVSFTVEYTRSLTQ